MGHVLTFMKETTRMTIKNVAAVVGSAAVGLAVLLSPTVSPPAQAHDSEDSPATTSAPPPGANGQLASGPSVPTAQLGTTITDNPSAAPLATASFTPATKATAAPSCLPTVYDAQCETLP
jgi:hypothetical protein